MNQTPAWRVLAASAIGTSHLARRSVCQDANLHLTLPDGTLLIAVADGAGSASRSAEGAACATRAALDFLAERLPGTEQWQMEALLSESMMAARTALFSLAGDGSSAGDFATTLLLTVVTGEQISIAQLGDGAIVIQLQDEKLQVLTRNGDSEYVNQTTFLTSSQFENSITLASWPADGVRGVAVMTDGIQLLAVHHGTNTAFGAFFAPMFRFAADPTSTDAGLEEFLASDAVSRRTDDDKTLVLTVRV